MESEAREAILKRLQWEEGEVLQAYCDRTGKVLVPNEWVHLSGLNPNTPVDRRKLLGNVSIGNGRNLYGRGITHTESTMLLKADITDVCMELDQKLKWWTQLDEVRQIVIADMAFNMGTHNLIEGWPSFLGHVKAGHYAQAADIMAGSKWYRDVKPRRADPLIAMMRDGKMQ